MAVARRPGTIPGTEGGRAFDGAKSHAVPVAGGSRTDEGADPIDALDVFAGLTVAAGAEVAAPLPAGRRRGLRSPRVVGGLVLAGYLLLAFAVFHRAWAQPSVRLIGTCCDQPPAVDLLRWTGFALVHGQNPFFTSYLAVPHGVNVIAQPNGMPLLGLLAWPAEAAFGPLVTYNLVITCGVAVSAFAAYVALRRWVGGVTAPVIGGLCYGFSPFLLTHALGHPNVMFAPVPPLFLLVLGDLLVTGRHRPWVDGVGLGLLAVAQFLIGPEVLAGLAIASLVVVVTLLVIRRTDLVGRGRAIGAGAAVAAGIGLVLAAWPLTELATGWQRLHGHFQTVTYGTDLANYLYPGLADQFRPHGGQYASTWHFALGEAGAFLGPVLIALCVVTAVRRWRSGVVKVATVVGLVMAILALGPDLTVAGSHVHIWLPARLLLALPVLQNMVPARLQLFTVLAVAVLVAAFVRWAETTVRGTTDPRRRRWLTVGTVVVLLAALVPLAPNVAYPTRTYPRPRFFTTSAVDVLPAGSAAFVVPYPQGGPDNGSAMVWQALAGYRFKLAGGYVFVPGSGAATVQLAGTPTLLTALLAVTESGGSFPPLGPPQRDEMRASLRTLGVTAVIVGPTPGRARAESLLTWVMGRPPQHRDGVALWTGSVP